MEIIDFHYSTKECSRLHFFILFGTLRVLLDNIWPDRQMPLMQKRNIFENFRPYSSSNSFTRNLGFFQRQFGQCPNLFLPNVKFVANIRYSYSSKQYHFLPCSLQPPFPYFPNVPTPSTTQILARALSFSFSNASISDLSHLQ